MSYGRINPVEATEIFIRSALVEGNIRDPLPFLILNRNLIEEVAGMEDKIRRRNILASEDVITEFYEERIGIAYNTKTLKKLIKDRGTDDFLLMNREDIMGYHPEEELSMCPDEITLSNRALPCSYHFNPGEENDGVTVHVPFDVVPLLPLESADWQMPALLREKITALIKGLPKEYRKRLVPTGQTVDTILRDIKNEGGSLITSLARFIHERFNISIPAAAWPVESIPDHLRMRFSIVNEKGEEIRSGRDIRLLQKDIPDGGESFALKAAKKQWEREGITSWDFADLSESIALKGKNGDEGLAYPALERGADGNIAIRLFRDMEKAAMTHRKGIAALYEIHFRKDVKFLKRHLTLPQEIKMGASCCGGARQIENAIYRQIIRILFERDIRKQEEFLGYAKSAGRNILPEAQKLLQNVIPAVKMRGEAGEILHRLEIANITNKSANDFITGLRKDIDRLMPEDFVEIHEGERLSDIPRHLRAIMIRAERGIAHLEKDKVKADKLRPFDDKLEEILKEAPSSSEEKKRAVEEYAWMVEEYRISVFAPEIKARGSVSPKKLKEKIAEIERQW